MGGTNIKYGLIDRAGHLMEKHTTPTPRTNFDEFTATVNHIVDDYAPRLKGVAMSVPGTVIHPQEQVIGGGMVPFLDQKELPHFIHVPEGVPFAVENDGKSAALAEMWLGNLNGVVNGAAIVLGTAIGGGLIINRHLYFGSHFQAGEFSFMADNANFSEQSLLGFHAGSAVGMIERISMAMGLPTRTDGRAVFDEINSGNAIALRIFRDFCRQIAMLIVNVQSVVDMERFVIGGGISAQPIVVTEINAAYQQARRAMPLLDRTLSQPEILAGKFQNDANMYGALYNLLLKVNGEDTETQWGVQRDRH
ncbi:sugar kinase and transcription regulator [Lacticaseibacillus thailandensis DSM 22698 = JCM 13996]|uniref:Sugar kinase and transcription regulator n=1 Tax=Lacticaseibacillus thailandensis DSM 22698 = JCM 13996 TaxID=1423810 RepID=A0A0R2CFX3_9LACO|nr:sugar kinase and transcription regulator [Lacticaseibacillus thailandensis DSM 22698 = JCM 13996]